MKKILQVLSLVLAIALVGGGSVRAQMLINGAGATFPYPIYSKWFDEYVKVDPSVRFNYQSIGSGGGIKAVEGQTVDFGASDAPLSDDQLKATPAPVLHFPTVMGAVVLTYNLPERHFPDQTPGPVIADIYLGKIIKWNDPEITALNPGVTLPDDRHRDCPSLRRQRHHLHFHRLPVARSVPNGKEGRQGYVGQMAGRTRRQG